MKLRVKTKTKKTSLENLMATQLSSAGIRGYRRNHAFIPGRKFQADFYFPKYKLALEVDGGEWLGQRGGHTNGTGYTSDRERDSLALMEGILTVRYAGGQIKDESAIKMFQKIYELRKEGKI